MSRTITVSADSRLSVGATVRELWRYRGLVWAFSSRDLKVKYFQTIFGPLWVLLTPLITVGVMTFVFGLMVKIPSDGLPYLLFYLVAIVPWYSFIGVFSQTTSSLEAHATLISKIYFPRLVIGASYAVNGAVDFLVGYGVCLIFAAYFSLLSLKFVLLMPVLLLIQMAWALGLGLLLAPLNARYRDVKHMIPLAIQLYYFANPIMYPVSVAPAWAKWIYHINPFSVVITAYRDALSGRDTDFLSLAGGIVIAVATLVAGAIVFIRKGQDMVDAL
jgi:lipopolysaccharide transport system permease protein